MANYFYTDTDGQKQGPIDLEQLKKLATNGNIEPKTPLEVNYAGNSVRKLRARDVPDLKFNTVEPPPIDNTPHAPPPVALPPVDSTTEHAQTSPGQTSPGFFDIGFTRFITNTWTSIFWVLTIVLAFLGCVGAMVFGASNNAPVLFIIAPIAAALFLLFMRMSFELTIVLFRIETHLRTIREKYENK